jgi:hypothetical protein
VPQGSTTVSAEADPLRLRHPTGALVVPIAVVRDDGRARGPGEPTASSGDVRFSADPEAARGDYRRPKVIYAAAGTPIPVVRHAAVAAGRTVAGCGLRP